jgi:hypothetical protein
MGDVFWMKAWGFWAVGVVEGALIGFDGPLAVFLNILVCKRHLLYKTLNY